jgi:hypothetical protein
MKVLHLYEVKLLDGTRYRGEIAYKDSEKIVLKQRLPQQKLSFYNNGIVSVRDIGFQKAYTLA